MTTTEQLPTWDMTDSVDQALVTGAVAVEQGFVQTYERQRQLGMLAILAPAFLVISALLILLFTVSALLFPNVRVFGAALPQRYRGYGRFPYTRTTCSPAKTIASGAQKRMACTRCGPARWWIRPRARGHLGVP